MNTFALLARGLVLAALAATPALAQDRPASVAAAPTDQRSAYPDLASGEAIYRGVCQGCHMPDAKGAVGAGAYPALAGNPKLAAPGYPILVVVNGQKAMPEFGSSLNDAQIAQVVGYIRTSFGNRFAGQVAAGDVAAMRPAR